MTSFLSWHIGLSLLAEIQLALALVLGILYWIQERKLKQKKVFVGESSLPSLETLDKVQYRLLVIGFISLTLGIGMVVLESSLKSKQGWMFLGWSVYGVILYLRRLTGFRGRRVLWYSLIGFALVILASLHGMGIGMMGGAR
ncbi:MAG: cytochrome c biogenesis protein CcsA [Deltaproteobacteria bacterium]|nr:cytochrome c biogenesis protein CcsA [Deltaproteobacteria bacterium]